MNTRLASMAQWRHARTGHRCVALALALGAALGALAGLGPTPAPAQAPAPAPAPAEGAGQGSAPGQAPGLARPPAGSRNTSNLPAPIELRRWIPPSWWSPLQSVSGDLDRDGVADLALILQRPLDAGEDPAYPGGSRALQVLFGKRGGGWRRGPLVPGLLPCADCLNSLAGMIESAVFDLTIRDDGVLEVGWVHRQQHIKAVRLYIGWDAARKRLALLADDVSMINPAGGPRTRVRREYAEGALWVNGELRTIAPRFIPIEEVSAATY